MAQSLGELFVSLRAETGGFVSALSKAAASAQQASKEISRSFSELQEIASQTFGAFGDFNPAISKLSFVLESAGGSASRMMKEFRDMGGALGPIAALGAGAAAGLTTIGIAAIGLAAHTAESAAKMHDLAQSTGVPITALSGLSYAAKAVGVDVETLAIGLERMSKSAFAASVAPAGATNAYTRLGVSVRDASGNLRPAQDIFADLADKFSRMPDGIEKTSAAMQIFGRGGAALIPVLNEGKAQIADLVDYAERTGAVLSGPAGEAAREFEMNLTKLSIAATGLSNQLMVQLLQALQAITGALAESSKASASAGSDFIKGISVIAKGILAVGETLFAFLADAGATIGTDLAYWSDAFVGFASVAKKALVFDFAGASAAYEDEIGRLKAIDKEGADSRAKIWADNAKFIQGVFGNIKPAAEASPKPKAGVTAAPGAPGASGRSDVVSEMVAKLQAEAAAELELAAATEKSVAASTLAKAAAEAETKIADIRTRLLEEEKNLRAQLADAQRDEAAGVGSASTTGVGGPGVRAEKLKGEIAGVQAMLAELTKDTPQIKSLYAEIASAGFGAKASEDLQKFIDKTNEETEAARRMAAAYAQGPAAAAGAESAAKIAPFEKQHSDLGELISGLKAVGAPAADIAKLQTAFDQLGASIDRAKASESAFVAADIAEKIAKEKESLTSEAEAYRLVAAAALSSAATQREAAARAEAVKFGAANPTATQAELNEVYETALAKLNEQRAETIAQEAAQFDLNASYAQELEKLQEIRAFIASSGESTIAIDTKIYETRITHLLDYQRQVFDAQNAELLGNEKIYEQGIQLTEQWDKAALSVGTIGEKFRAMANEIEIEGQNLGEKFIGTLKKGVDDVSSSLAKFIVTGKSGFTELLNSMAESLLKAQIQWSFSKLLGAFGPKTGAGGQQSGPGGTPGIVPGPLGIGGALAGALGLKVPGGPGGRPSGTAADPLFVTMVGGAPLAAAAPGAGGAGGLFGLGGGASVPANGSSGSPFYVIPTDSTGSPFGTGNALPITPDDSSGSGGGGLYGSWDSGEGDTGGGGAGGGGGFMSQISGVFSKIFSSIRSVLGSIVGSIGSLASSVGGGIASFFGGFLAGGGDATPGRAYVVGENGPEIFMPGQSGRVIPFLRGFRATGGSVLKNNPYMVGENGPEVFMPDSVSAPQATSRGGGDMHLHIYGVTDADSFNRSKGQIWAEMQQQYALAHYRNKG